MKKIAVKYDGHCTKCGARLNQNDPAMYEKSIGIFCIGCEPVDVEEIRAYRQAKANAKADRLNKWADNHIQKARQIEDSMPTCFDDYAYITQPGYIPGRDKLIKRQERSFKEANLAEELSERAKDVRKSVRVKGDAEREREAERQAIREWIKPGMCVDTYHYGVMKVVKVNKKTVTVDGSYGKFNIDLSYIKNKEGE